MDIDKFNEIFENDLKWLIEDKTIADYGRGRLRVLQKIKHILEVEKKEMYELEEIKTNRILYRFLVNEEHEILVYAENEVEAVNLVKKQVKENIATASWEVVCFENEIINS